MAKKVQRKEKAQKFSKGTKEQKSVSLAKRNRKSSAINLENQNYGKSCEIEIIQISESTSQKQGFLKNGLKQKTKLESQKDSGHSTFKEFIKGHIAKKQLKFSKEQINQRLIKIIQKQKYFQNCKQKSQGSGFSSKSKEKISEGLKKEGAQVKLENRSLKKIDSKEQIEAEDQQSSLKQGEYSVQKIVSSIMKNGQVQYEIKWVGYPDDENTYEPMNNLMNIASMVANFEQKERLAYQKKCKQKDKQIREKNNQLKQKDKLIEQKEYQIQLKGRQIAQRDKQIQEMGSNIRNYLQKIKQMEKQLQSMKRLQKEKEPHTLSSTSTNDQTERILPQIKETRSIQVQTQTFQHHFQNYPDQMIGFFEEYPLEKKISDSINDIDYLLPLCIADRILHSNQTVLQCEEIVEEGIEENPSSLVQQFDFLRGSRVKRQQEVNQIFGYTKHEKAKVQDVQTSYMDLLEG